MAALLTADTLVVSQRAKFVELTNQYDIWDPQGVTLGFIDEQGPEPPAQDGPLRHQHRSVPHPPPHCPRRRRRRGVGGHTAGQAREVAPVGADR